MLPFESQVQTLRALGGARPKEIVERYMAALQSGDVDRVLALLTEEPTWSMPPMPVWYRGRAAVAAFLAPWPSGRFGAGVDGVMTPARFARFGLAEELPA